MNNPHKGWYWHYIDNGFGRINYRKGVEDDYTLDFPCLNHLYLRFDWADIEKEEGIFDWYYIDEIVNKWSKYNYRFAFRVCCYEAGEIKYATPEWVREAGAKGYFCGNDCWQPDYGDEIFLEKLENFMKEFGKKFNGHPLVEFVDVGTYGTWGEGHTGYGSGNSFPTDVLIKHINLHLKYFPDTYVIMNDDMINASANEMVQAEKNCLIIALVVAWDSGMILFYVRVMQIRSMLDMIRSVHPLCLTNFICKRPLI